MFIKIKNFDPKFRSEVEKLPEIEDLEVQLGETKIFYKNNIKP